MRNLRDLCARNWVACDEMVIWKWPPHGGRQRLLQFSHSPFSTCKKPTYANQCFLFLLFWLLPSLRLEPGQGDCSIHRLEQWSLPTQVIWPRVMLMQNILPKGPSYAILFANSLLVSTAVCWPAPPPCLTGAFISAADIRSAQWAEYSLRNCHYFSLSLLILLTANGPLS